MHVEWSTIDIYAINDIVSRREKYAVHTGIEDITSNSLKYRIETKRNI